jgi:hypothetical protein
MLASGQYLQLVSHQHHHFLPPLTRVPAEKKRVKRSVVVARQGVDPSLGYEGVGLREVGGRAEGRILVHADKRLAFN